MKYILVIAGVTACYAAGFLAGYFIHDALGVLIIFLSMLVNGLAGHYTERWRRQEEEEAAKNHKQAA